MPTTTPTILDQMSADKTKITERLARLDTDRAMIATQLADLGFLPGGALLTRVNTRSAVSRSVNCVAIIARSVSRRASRSLSFVLSALIWSNIVGVVVGMVALSSFSSIG